METKVCGGMGYMVEDLEQALIMGTCGLEFWCGVTWSVTIWLG